MAKSATRYTLTTIGISVHPKDENPFFSENATHVSLDDEAGGAFLVLTQCPDDVGPGVAKMKINIDEFPLIVEAVNKLLDQKLPD
jgi:hypothetical protein